MNHLPNLSFLQSRPARIALARQRFFEKGHTPTGVVGDAVFESWARCLSKLGKPPERAAFQPVTASRTQLALSKNAVGTTAPGEAARTGKPVCVLGGEHFFDSVKDMHCAAAPIHDMRGQLAGILDISSEHIPLAFDAAAVAGLDAGAIKNRLLVAQSVEHLVIGLQVAPALASRFIGKGFERRHRLCPVIEACSIHALPNAGSRIQPAGRAAWLPTHWQTASGPADLPLGPSGRSS